MATPGLEIKGNLGGRGEIFKRGAVSQRVDDIKKPENSGSLLALNAVRM